MKIAAVSDMHGNLSFDIERPSDILCICGDIFPLEIQQNEFLSQAWLFSDFIPWCERQPVGKCFLTAGNHDFLFFLRDKGKDNSKKLFNNTNIIYLKDTKHIYDFEGKSYVIYGTPWCHLFGYWPYMEDDKKLVKKFNKIPSNADILLTHDAPYGTSDKLDSKDYSLHIGSKPLRDAVISKKPKLMLHGHLHTANHSEEILNSTSVYNVSILDNRYKKKYSPLYLEL